MYIQKLQVNASVASRDQHDGSSFSFVSNHGDWLPAVREFTRQHSRRGKVLVASIPAGIVLLCTAIGVGVGVSRAAGRNTGKVNPVAAAEHTLWKTGDMGILAYRIPLLTFTPKGYLIAAAEARKHMQDAGPKYLTIRRSRDKGATWGPPKYILNHGALVKEGFMLGSILVDHETNTTFIVFLQCSFPPPDVGCPGPATYIINSTDDGKTWGEPRNLTHQIGHVTFAAGPGYGIQKQKEPFKGRLIICGHRSMIGTFCILSDDHGMTWRYGKQGLAALPSHQSRQKGDFQPDECQIVELPNGSIMLNARNEQKYRCRCRIVAMSYDGADTFPMEKVKFDEALIDPTVAAGLLYHDSVLFFTNPKNSTHRMKLTLRWSFSHGNHWDGEYVIWHKQSGYSTMASSNHPTDKNYIYILFEKGIHREYESISFVKVKLTQ
ncbi:sialidase-1-like [Amphiura filiformis]|uniref:sialidase-1-like n=1 Tax=Amphiura filiformis TaxID=82378 RepID=UPI003B21B137